jgi:hypothetical protein
MHQRAFGIGGVQQQQMQINSRVDIRTDNSVKITGDINSQGAPINIGGGNLEIVAKKKPGSIRFEEPSPTRIEKPSIKAQRKIK